MEIDKSTIDLTSTYEEMLQKIRLTPEDFILKKTKKVKSKELTWNSIPISLKSRKVSKQDDVVLTPLFVKSSEAIDISSDDDDLELVEGPGNEVIELSDSDEEPQKEPDRLIEEVEQYHEELANVKFEPVEEVISLEVLAEEQSGDTLEYPYNSVRNEDDELSCTTVDSTVENSDLVLTVIKQSNQNSQETVQENQLTNNYYDYPNLIIDETYIEEQVQSTQEERSEGNVDVADILDNLSESNNIEIVVDEESNGNNTKQLDNLNDSSYLNHSSIKISAKRYNNHNKNSSQKPHIPILKKIKVSKIILPKNKKATIESQSTLKHYNQKTDLCIEGTEISNKENQEDTNSFSFIIQKVESVIEDADITNDHNHNTNPTSNTAEIGNKHFKNRELSSSTEDYIQNAPSTGDFENLRNTEDTSKSLEVLTDDIQMRDSTHQNIQLKSSKSATENDKEGRILDISDEDVNKLAEAAPLIAEDLDHSYTSSSDIPKHSQSEEFPIIEGIASSPDIEEEIVQDDLMDAEENEKYMEDIRNKVKAHVKLFRNKSLKKTDDTEAEKIEPLPQPKCYLRVKSRQSLFPCLAEQQSNLSVIADIPEPFKKVPEFIPAKPNFISYEDKGVFCAQKPSASGTPGVENEIRMFLKRPRKILPKPVEATTMPKAKPLPLISLLAPAISDTVMSDTVTSDPVTSDPVASDTVTSDPVTSDPVTSVTVRSDPVTSEEDHLKQRTESIRNILNESVNGNPFQSNTLDEFLSQAKLNISYDIPKNGAEDGLTKDYSTVEVVPARKKIDQEDKKNKPIAAAYKPKTLAEKRKIMEKNMRKHKNKSTIEQSYIMYKDKKIFVKAVEKEKCLATIDCTKSLPDEPKEISPRKLSLLTELYQKEKSPLKYKPGPMSKKYTLQVDSLEWVTAIKKLPKVFLSVMPEFGKPVHKNIISIVNNYWNEEVTEDRTEFALSALKTDSKPNIFKFPVMYENGQESILVRRKLPAKYVPRPPLYPVKEKDDSKIIKNVIDKLLNYVEVKEISETLLKYDVVEPENEVPRAEEPVPDKPKRKITSLIRTSRELLRLNCKVVSMEAEETERKIRCKKPYCKLGCICCSLKCLPIIRGHCQKARCMFNCNCPKERVNKIISLVGSDLSSDVVSRIEDEAKKNLAKVEKEFTQTIIYTNNRAIVVPTANQPRRAARVPKKYCYDDEDVEKEKKRLKKTTNPCCVQLNKLDLKDLIPLCLVHKLYDCHCEGLSRFPVEVRRVSYEDSENKPKKTKIKIAANEDSDYKPKTVSSDDSNDTPYSVSGRRIKKKPLYKTDFIYSDVEELELIEEDVDVDHCARTTVFVQRRKAPSGNRTMVDFENTYNEADKLRVQTKESSLLTDCEKLKLCIISNFEAEPRAVPKPKKRKKVIKKGSAKPELEKPANLSEPKRKKLKLMEVLEVPTWQEANTLTLPKVAAGSNVTGNMEDLQINHTRKQRLKERFDDVEGPSQLNKSLVVMRVPAPHPHPINKVFQGEILVSEANSQLFTRILPWTALLEGYINKTLKVFFFGDNTVRLMLTPNTTSPIDGFLDVETDLEKILESPPMNPTSPKMRKHVAMVKDLLAWLHRGRLSNKYQVHKLAFGLQELNKGQFEIRGNCYQNSQFGLQLKNETLSTEISVSMHKHIDGTTKMLQCQKGYLTMKPLAPEVPVGIRVDTWAQLPSIPESNWRQIYLYQDFVYLHFIQADFSISYDKLSSLVRNARAKNVTIRAFSREIDQYYEIERFGVYVTPRYEDRIFIGPYPEEYNDVDVATLVQMNDSLVCRERLSINLNEPTQCGQWLRQLKSNEPQKSQSQNSKMFNLNGINVTVKECQPRDPSEFNRFLITNIPTFGYLGAIYLESTGKIEVSWPFENKVLEFDSVEDSKDIVTIRLHRLMLAVPETFTIKVQVLTKLDLDMVKPVDHKLLNGEYLCGSFGTVHYLDLSEDICSKFNVTKESVMNRMRSKIHDSVRVTCIEVANILGVSSEEARTMSVNDLFPKLTTVTANERKNQKQLQLDRYWQQKRKQKNLKKLKQLFGMLTPKLRKREESILEEILKNEDKAAQVWETQFSTNQSVFDVAGSSIAPDSCETQTKEPAIKRRKRQASCNEEPSEVSETYLEPLPFVITTVETLAEEDY